ncbi:MAG TPA: hypothetical protein VJQ81_14675, partial [Reyranella sp.]|nr:hypothetical protein [Reyranella sp.]
MNAFEVTQPLPKAAFGATVRLERPLDAELPDALPRILANAGGLLHIPDVKEIGRDPSLLV